MGKATPTKFDEGEHNRPTEVQHKARSVGQAARIQLQLEPVDTSQDSSGSALQYLVIEL